jgi:hypothetical protein
MTEGLDKSRIEQAIRIYERVFDSKNTKYSQLDTWRDRNLFKIDILDDLAFLAFEKREDTIHIWLMGSLQHGLGTGLFQNLCKTIHDEKISKLTVSTYPNQWETMYSWLQRIGFNQFKAIDEKIYLEITSDSFTSYFDQKLKIEFEKHMIATSFESWYPTFAKYTFPAKFITLSPEFIQYLQLDGIILPKSIRTVKEDSDDENDEIVPEFKEIQSFIAETIKDFSIVFPKLNWSAPKDSTWILPENILKCDTVEEVFMSLKSSEILQNEVLELVKNDKILVLKKWVNVDPTMEFRLFVNDGLVGISQRDCTIVYPTLVNSKEFVEPILIEFFETVIQDVFPLDKCMFFTV